MISQAPLADTPFCLDLDMELIEWGSGRTVVALEVTKRMTNRMGVAHGGIVSTLADVALGMAWRSAAPERDALGTLSLNINFMAPGVGRLVAEGRMVRLTGVCAFCEGSVSDSRGVCVATAQGVFRAKLPKVKEQILGSADASAGL